MEIEIHWKQPVDLMVENRYVLGNAEDLEHARIQASPSLRLLGINIVPAAHFLCDQVA